jgi:hypothetical protein
MIEPPPIVFSASFPWHERSRLKMPDGQPSMGVYRRARFEVGQPPVVRIFAKHHIQSAGESHVGKNFSFRQLSNLRCRRRRANNFSYHKVLCENDRYVAGRNGMSLAHRQGKLFRKRRFVMKRVTRSIVAVVSIAAFVTVAVAGQLFAQILPKADVDDQQLRSFAKVYMQVEKIRQTYEPRAKESPGPEEGKQIQQEAQAKFQEALTKEGLNEESYARIFEIARADEGVRKKVVQMIVEEKAKS